MIILRLWKTKDYDNICLGKRLCEKDYEGVMITCVRGKDYVKWIMKIIFYNFLILIPVLIFLKIRIINEIVYH